MIGAVDIGGTKIAVGMVDDSGHLLARLECPTDAEKGLADGLNRIVTMLHQTMIQAGGSLCGIGIGCTGPVHPKTGHIGDVEFLPGWERADLAGELSRKFNVSAAIENDADAAALGELSRGAGKGAQRFIYVTVSTGIGGGLVIGGQLYRGVDDAHPEMGHHVIDPSGPSCFCGAHGCWESLASGPALARRGGMESAQAVCMAAGQGEPTALAAVEREGYYLGLGLANLITLFTPDIIALGGGVMRSHYLFRNSIQSVIQQNCGLVPYQKTTLVPATLGADTGLIGAACVWLHYNEEF